MRNSNITTESDKITYCFPSKDGVPLGTFEVLDLSSIEEPLPLLVNAQNADVTDLIDVMPLLRLGLP